MGLVSILKYCGLMFRSWVGIMFFFVMALLGLALMRGIVAIGIGVLGIFVLFWGILDFEPKHIIEKHGQKMVAYVNSHVLYVTTDGATH